MPCELSHDVRDAIFLHTRQMPHHDTAALSDADAVADKKQNIKSLEGQSSNKELKIEGDLSHGEKTESTLDKDVFVDELEPAGADVHQNPDMDEFVEEIPQRDSTTEIDNEQNPFVDRLPPDDSGDSVEVIG